MPGWAFIWAMETAIRWSGLVGLMATDTSTAPRASGSLTRTTRCPGAGGSPAGAVRANPTASNAVRGRIFWSTIGPFARCKGSVTHAISREGTHVFRVEGEDDILARDAGGFQLVGDRTICAIVLDPD